MGNKIPLHMVDTPIKKAIKEDMQALSKGFQGFGVEDTSFWRVEDTNIWVFRHKTHRSCSSVEYTSFSSALNVTRIQLIDNPECMESTMSHVALLPFFRDNVSLHRSLHIHASHMDDSKPEKGAVLSLVRQVKAIISHPQDIDDVPEYLSTGGAPTNSKGHTFSEDVWSARLCGCLKQFLPKEYGKLVTLTCKIGKEFKHRQAVYTGVPPEMCGCYPFHRSPDITIGSTQVMLSRDEQDSGSEVESGSEAEAVIENSLLYQRQSDTIPSKLGEVLANLHISLVKKVLRSFVVKGNVHEKEYKGSGLLLHSRTGGILCKMAVQSEKDKLCPLQICIDDFASQVLTPESLCSQLQALLGCVVHQDQQDN